MPINCMSDGGKTRSIASNERIIHNGADHF